MGLGPALAEVAGQAHNAMQQGSAQQLLTGREVLQHCN